MSLITDEVKTLIGLETERLPAVHAVEASEVRRFCQATLDTEPAHWDTQQAASSRYGGVVAPLAYPIHMFRRAPDSPDALDRMSDPDFDGLAWDFGGLPPVRTGLRRLVNGGYEYQFFRNAAVGERVFRQGRYKDIYQRDGQSGPLVFVLVEEIFTTESGDRLLKSTNTLILR